MKILDNFVENAEKTVDDEIESQKGKGKKQDQAVAIALSKKERGEIDELSTAGRTAAGDPGDVEGTPGQKKKKKRHSLIREEDPTVDEVLNYLLQNLGAK